MGAPYIYDISRLRVKKPADISIILAGLKFSSCNINKVINNKIALKHNTINLNI